MFRVVSSGQRIGKSCPNEGHVTRVGKKVEDPRLEDGVSLR